MLAISAWRRLLQLGRLSYDYDEGTYWQSLESMRHGHRLFAEVFSSQPPAFLSALSPIYNVLGGGIVAARLPVVVGSLMGLVAVFVIGRGLAGSWTGVLAMALLAFDPLYTALSDRLSADLPSVVFGLVAVAVVSEAARRCGGTAWWVIGGAVLALSIMTKLLGVVFVVPVAWFALSRPGPRGRRAVAVTAGLLVGTALLAAPYFDQLGSVYRESIGLHVSTRASEPQSLDEKVKRIIDSGPQLLPLLVALVGAIAGAAGRVGWVGMLVVWLLAAVVVDLSQGPLFIHHLVVLGPPIALLAGASPRLLLEAAGARAGRAAATRTALAAAGAALAISLGVVAMTSPLPAEDPRVEPVVIAIQHFVDPGVFVVSDELFAAAYTGHPAGPNLVDVSLARITSGNLTTADVEAGTDQSGARAVIFATDRLSKLPGFQQWVAQRFKLVYDNQAGLQVWVRGNN